MAFPRGLGLATSLCIAAAVSTARGAECSQGPGEAQAGPAGGPVERMVETFEGAVERLLAEAAGGGPDDIIPEARLSAKLSSRHSRVFKMVRDARTRADRGDLLTRLALANARLGDIPRVQSIARILTRDHPEEAALLGEWVQGDDTIVRCVGAKAVYAGATMRLVEGLRTAAEEAFGITLVERLAGRRMRVVLTVDPKVPEPRIWFDDASRWHTTLRCEVPDEEFLQAHDDFPVVYGFARAMADAVARWRDDDGAVGDYLAAVLTDRVVLVMRNQRWPQPGDDLAQGIRRLKTLIGDTKPGTSDRPERLALMLALEDAVGRQEIGRALDELRRRGTEEKDPGHLPVHVFENLRIVLREHAAADMAEHLDSLFADRG